jgi:hypothetical protein
VTTLHGADLVNAAMVQIDQDKSGHYQDSWIRLVPKTYDGYEEPGWDWYETPPEGVTECRTAMCMAGHMAILQGYPSPTVEEMYREPEGWWMVNSSTKESQWRTVVQSNADGFELVDIVMRRELPSEIDVNVFNGYNSRRTLRRMVNEMNERLGR